MLNEYKNVFNYDNLQQIVKGSNLNNENNEEIFNFIENIEPNFINSIKGKIFKLNSIEFKKASNFLETKVEENINFKYFIELEKILFDGYLLINFCKLNSIGRDSFLRAKIFFIKEKILIIFNNEQKKNFGQIGEIKELENKYIFDIDYLIAFKNNEDENSFFTKIFRKENALEIFYKKLYEENNPKNIFEFILPDEIIVYILNFKNNNCINILNKENNYQQYHQYKNNNNIISSITQINNNFQNMNNIINNQPIQIRNEIMDNNNKNGNLNLNFQKGFNVTMKQNYVHPKIFNSQYLDNDINIYKSNINNKKTEVQKFNSKDNKKYINQIDELKKQLLEEQENNNKLKTENKKLEKIINSLKQENKDVKKKLEKEINKLKENLKLLENELNTKNNEIKNYILEINDLKENKNQITSIKPGEKIFSVLFMTQGNNDIFNYSMTCKNTELFVRLEERLYDDFPKYKKLETIFMVDARRILRFQTLDENKIKRNDIISLFVVDPE